MEIKNLPYNLSQQKNMFNVYSLEKIQVLQARFQKNKCQSQKEQQLLMNQDLEQYQFNSQQSNMCSPISSKEQDESQQNLDSWDNSMHYSSVNQTSTTPISSCSIIPTGKPQRHSILTQRLSDEHYDKDYLNDKIQQTSTSLLSVSAFRNSHEMDDTNSIADNKQRHIQMREETKQKINEAIYRGNSQQQSQQRLLQSEEGDKIESRIELTYSFLNFNPTNMNSQTLYCDIPFSLNNFIEEVEGILPVQRLCSYNNFKRVVDIKTFRSGTMMDCTLESLSNCQFNQEYLVSILENKGNKILHELAQTLRTYYKNVENLIPDALYITQNQNAVFLQKRVEASKQEKERILSLKDPRQNFYFKTYTINWENFGSPMVCGYGYSKGFCEAIGLSIQDNKKYILRKGFIECFDQNDRLRQMFKTFLTVPWNLKKEPQIIKTNLKFITFDNIIINNAPVAIETHNLSYNFDEENNFDSKFSEMMIIIQINLDKTQDCKLKSQRVSRERRPIDDKNNDEIDLYYSRESQSFLERYYKDIYGEKYCLKKQLRRCEYIDLQF